MSLVIEPALRCDLTEWRFAMHELAHDMSYALITDRLTNRSIFKPPKCRGESAAMNANVGSHGAKRNRLRRVLIDDGRGLAEPAWFVRVDVITPPGNGCK